MPNNILAAIDQLTDVNGSDQHSSDLNLPDEGLSLGAKTDPNGTNASIISVLSGNLVTVSNLTDMTINSEGNYISLSNTSFSVNTGNFLITNFIDSTSVQIINNNHGIAPDANNGFIVWSTRNAYSLQDDLNYVRTDRRLIKGVNYDQLVNPYIQPTATNVNVQTNLTNLSGKTTDARGFITNRYFYDITIPAGRSSFVITDFDNLKHSDDIDHTGVPTFDQGIYQNNYTACYVQINDGYNEVVPNVQSGLHQGEKIFGLTYNGASSSPDSIEIRFFSVPNGLDIKTNSSPYTWETTMAITLLYGYFQRLDQIPDETFRNLPIIGLVEADNSGGGGGGGNGITASEHETLRQLIHLADGIGGPFEGFASGAFRETIPSQFLPTSITWYDDNTKSHKIVAKTINYLSNKMPSSFEWTAFDIDGFTPLAIVEDVLTYQGSFELNRTRSITSVPGSNTVLDENTHPLVRQLIHLADGIGGPFEGFTSGAFRESLPSGSPFPTSLIWYNDNTKVKKIVEKDIVYNLNKALINSVTYKVYGIDGLTVLATITDTIDYNGVFEISRSRTIS